MEYVLNFLQYVNTRHITIPVESIIKGQGSRLLLVDIPKLGNITLAQSVDNLLIGLKFKVVAIR